jgi:hypothetical protein
LNAAVLAGWANFQHIASRGSLGRRNDNEVRRGTQPTGCKTLRQLFAIVCLLMRLSLAQLLLATGATRQVVEFT